jgi:hypothetical protein
MRQLLGGKVHGKIAIEPPAFASAAKRSRSIRPPQATYSASPRKRAMG